MGPRGSTKVRKMGGQAAGGRLDTSLSSYILIAAMWFLLLGGLVFLMAWWPLCSWALYTVSKLTKQKLHGLE